VSGIVQRERSAAPSNGRPERRNYVYRGTGADRLTAWMDGLSDEEREQRDARARLEVAFTEMYGRRP